MGQLVSHRPMLALCLAALLAVAACVPVKTHGAVAADVPGDAVGDGATARACESSLDCAGTPTPRCLVAAHRCVSCYESNGQCPETQFCDPQTNTCRTGCRSDGYCTQNPLTPWCDATTGSCVACSRDTHCRGRVCRHGMCEFACNNGEGCAEGTECSERACIPRAGLIAELLLDRSLADAVTGSTASATGTLSYTGARRTGSAGAVLRAASLVGDGRIDVTIPALPTGRGSVTFALWVRTASAASMPLLEVGTSETRALRWSEGRVVFGTEADALTSPTGLSDGGWHHVALSLGDDGLARLYADGLLVDRSSFPVELAAAGTTVLHLGGRAEAPTEGFVGAVDDVRVYGRALSDDEVHALGSEAP